MRNYSIIVLALVAHFTLCMNHLAVAADNVIQITSDGVSQSDQPAKAKSESLKNAVDKACLQVITGLIGEAKVEKNMAVLQAKVLSQTSKFVQYY